LNPICSPFTVATGGAVDGGGSWPRQAARSKKRTGIQWSALCIRRPRSRIPVIFSEPFLPFMVILII
jgi:hypothetical protein